MVKIQRKWQKQENIGKELNNKRLGAGSREKEHNKKKDKNNNDKNSNTEKEQNFEKAKN